MKLFKTSRIAEIDQYTIDNEPVSHIDLMERASKTVFDYIISKYNWKGLIAVFCGPGNNGGDGLAVARMLAEIENRFEVEVFILDFGKGLTGSSKINFNRLVEQAKVKIQFIHTINDLPDLRKNILLLDALFGAGLNRALDGIAAKTVNHINNSMKEVLAIDIPSGLMGENNSNNLAGNIIKANTTITFQFPKLSFLFSENENYVGDWIVKKIGLHPHAIKNFKTPYSFLENVDIQKLLKPRSRFSHKGNFGHALLISGAYGKMGAAILASKACLRSGVGLLTTHVPGKGCQIIQTAVPEAMTGIDQSEIMFTGVEDFVNYSAIGIGPGIGQKVNTSRGLYKLITETNLPMVFDADALNILSDNIAWLNLLPFGSILTPHPKEFERLAGKTENSFDRIQLAIAFSQKYKVILVIKGAHTAIVSPEGEVWFNSTGNSGMATAGSGDVLTGVILALLAQGYSSIKAACIGVFIHGLAGDFALKQRGYEGLIAGDIVDNLGRAFQHVSF